MPLDPAILNQIPDTLTVDVDGKPIPLRDVPFVKDATDLPTLIKTGYDAHREVGARIPLRTDGKPESIAKWRETHLPALYKNGILEAPPASPKDYGVLKPNELPEGIVWNDELATKFATTLHKHGANKALAGELLDLYKEALMGAQTTLKTDFDSGMAALKKEHGDKLEERMEMAKRLTNYIFRSPEELAFIEQTGLGDHPGYLSVLLRLAPFAQQDSSFMKDLEQPGAGGPGSTGAEDLRRTIADIMSNKENPKYKGYWSRDPAIMAEIDGLYKRVYGGGQVDLGSGVEVAGRQP